MNYRHAFHAGNFADVLKHAALVSVLQHLKKKHKPVAVIDTHAGRGVYEIRGSEARKTGEAAEGVERLLTLPAVPGILTRYLAIVRSFGDGIYPGSPLISAQCLGAEDRLIAIEYQQQEFGALSAALKPFRNAQAISGDGYRELPGLLPPAARRGLILIDPPYEQQDEFARAAQTVIVAHRRFATGIYMLWYPAKALPLAEATAAELLNAGVDSLVRIELNVGVKASPQREGRGPPMTATGLLVVNPPYGFSTEMSAILPFLQDNLAQAPGASHRIDILAER